MAILSPTVIAAIESFFRSEYESVAVKPYQTSIFSLNQMSGDGSNRKFFRVTDKDGATVVAVLPESLNPKTYAEFQATRDIGYHLKSAGNPVPEILGSDPQTGLVLFEDFGDVHLYDLLCRDRAAGLACYPEIISALINMQVSGCQEFDQGWCHDTSVYDRSVMIGRESEYFYDAFWKAVLSGAEVHGIREEFADLADKIANHQQHFFLHRDFQSKNIMIHNNSIGIIDFQGGRIGPPGYDIASLLIDPYAGLSFSEQQQLLTLYLEKASTFQEIDVDRIQRSYPYLAVQRNLQIIGAYAFLTYQAGKPFFEQFILPSLELLCGRLAEPLFADLSQLKKTVATALSRYKRLNR